MTLAGAELAIGALAAGSAGLAAYATFTPRAALWCPVISRGPTGSRGVALTFDDGPWPGSTPAILDVLARAGVSATFFVIGRNAARWPGLLDRICAEGHIVGNHSYDHDRLGLLRRRRYWLDQLARTDDAIARVSGAPPAFFRPPMGFTSGHMAAALRARGHRAVTWSKRGLDGVPTTPDRIAARLRRCGPGDIVALHDGTEPGARRDGIATARALGPVIRSIRARALEPVRLDHLLGLAAYRQCTLWDRSCGSPEAIAAGSEPTTGRGPAAPEGQRTPPASLLAPATAADPARRPR
jgi:peptidoglycan-N-acetylglucosamine deacetylase